jgi:uncharacterized protein YndB with AHSA1/START domain
MTGDELVEFGEVREVRHYDRIVLTLTQIFRRTPGPETTIVVSFEEIADGTLMTFRQTGFDSIERRDGNEEGWRGCLDKLEARVRRLKRDETELRRLH